ncbi:MAG: BolA/IbaG family iron-sulfur metabolism protein [SAR86 cluster bacterium]|jgi:BolA family transcriptional regulator, general stress-responsive regulator|nr:BolA/IbaG family iron-sulfur metabolism protein [SAR86 cluster bacterium]
MTICEEIELKLQEELYPIHLEVINESHMHNVEPGKESHLRIVAVSSIFEDLNMVKRHQLIYKNLGGALEGPVHAISLHTFSPEEWSLKEGKTIESPDCLGGSS